MHQAMAQARFRTLLRAAFRAGPVTAQGQIQNVGHGGLFVGTASLPNEGESVALDFQAPDGQRIRLTGIVWWTRANGKIDGRAAGFGVRLLDPGESYQSFIERLAS
jgi:Tfp pilus assembly protein PilZ